MKKLVLVIITAVFVLATQAQVKAESFIVNECDIIGDAGKEVKGKLFIFTKGYDFAEQKVETWNWVDAMNSVVKSIVRMDNDVNDLKHFKKYTVECKLKDGVIKYFLEKK